MSNVNLHPSISDLADDHRRKFGGIPATELSLRDLACIPSWAAVPPLVVELVNEHLGHGETAVDDGGEIPDLADLAGNLLNGLDDFFSRGKR